MNSAYLFVYGLLLDNYETEVSEIIRSNCQILGQASVNGRLFEVNGYPGIILDGSLANHVQGQLLEIKRNQEEVFNALDHFEGISDLNSEPFEYRRALTDAHTKSGFVRAWIYEYNWSVSGLRIIPNGDYRTFVQ